MQHAEDRRIGTNTQHQRHQCSDREPPMFSQLPECVPNILARSVDEREAALIAIHLFDLVDTTKLAPGRRARLPTRQAPLKMLLGEQIEVCLNLLAELGV